jgi:hypothetical protein
MEEKVDDALYRVDTADPVSCFVTDRLRLEWPAVLIITFFIYGPIEKILFPYLGGYSHLSFSYPMKTWVPDIESLLTGFVEFPFFFAYYIWTGRGLGRVFRRLARAEIFFDNDQFEQFWTRARRSFNHRGWWMVAVVFAVGTMALWQFSVWSRNPAVAPWFDLQYEPPRDAAQGDLGTLVNVYGRHPLARLMSIFLIGLVAYALVQIVIREVLALVWLTRLWREMGEDVVVHPYHHDDAGGLGGVGQHALQLSTFVLFLLLFIVMGSFLPSLRVSAGGPRPPLWDERLVIVWVLYFAFVGSTIRPLFIRPHELMCRARDRRVAVVSQELDELLEQQQKAVSMGSDELESIIKRIDELKKVRAQLIEDAPVWPFTTALRIKLGLSSLPALLLPAAKYGLEKGFDGLTRLFTAP